MKLIHYSALNKAGYRLQNYDTSSSTSPLQAHTHQTNLRELGAMKASRCVACVSLRFAQTQGVPAGNVLLLVPHLLLDKTKVV